MFVASRAICATHAPNSFKGIAVEFTPRRRNTARTSRRAAASRKILLFNNPGDGDDEWQASVYRVADAAHDPERALEIVSAWAGMQS
jgi:hypothetical protein